MKIPILLLSTMIIATSANALGRVVVDPNITRLPSIEAQESPIAADERLSQQVSYESGYKRLHAVIEDLNKIGGVRVHCGKNKDDWQVQDIPLVVCANNIPLGKLYRAIADGTHTIFTSTKVGSDDSASNYRICRNKKSADDIVKQMEDRYYAKFADAQWGWETLASFGSKPGLDRSGIGPWAQGFSKVLAYLGEDAEKKVLAGQSVIVDAETSPQIADALRLLYKQHAPKDCRLEDIEKSEMRIALDAVGDSGLLYLCGGWAWRHSDGTISQSGYPIPRCAEALKNVKGFDYTPRPPSELPKPQEDYPKDRLHILATLQDWELPVLKTKITLETPKDKDHPTFADAVTAIAKASGFNIVCEDFASHQDEKFIPAADKFYVKDTTLGEAIRSLDCYQPAWLNNEHGNYQTTWMINEQDKLIVGWASEWREHHYYLVPESLVSGLQDKMRGNGVQFDDIVPLVNLSMRQTGEWITHTKDIYTLNFWSSRPKDEICAWRLYAALSDSDKTIVKSEAGLPLAKFDPVWLVSFFQDVNALEVRYNMSDEDKKQADIQVQLKKKYLTDPKLITALVMRMPQDYQEHDLEMACDDGEQKVMLKFSGPLRPFPLHLSK